MNQAVDDAGGALPPDQARQWRARYRQVLGDGALECPLPAPLPPEEGADIFCWVRSLLSTAIKQGMAVHAALEDLFMGRQPAFMQREETHDQAA